LAGAKHAGALAGSPGWLPIQSELHSGVFKTPVPVAWRHLNAAGSYRINSSNQ